LWVDGQNTQISWSRTPETPGSVPLKMDPTGQRVLLSGAPGNVAPFGVFPVDACLAEAVCDIEVADGFPVWSPDGWQTIVAADYEQLDDIRLEATLYRGDSNGVIGDRFEEGAELGFGSAPFWLDNGRFGFARFDASSGKTDVVVVDEISEELMPLFTTDDLVKVLLEAPSGLMRIDYVVPDPLDADRLLVATADALQPQGAAHLFTYNMVDGMVQHRFAFLDDSTIVRRGYRFSPNGRFLVITGLTTEPGELALYLHDLQTGATQTIILDDQYFLPAHLYFDWSADGNWLALVQDGYVRFIHPHTGYEQWAVSPILNCSSVAWVKDELPQ
jgi:hypothetical protein